MWCKSMLLLLLSIYVVALLADGHDQQKEIGDEMTMVGETTTMGETTPQTTPAPEEHERKRRSVNLPNPTTEALPDPTTEAPEHEHKRRDIDFTKGRFVRQAGDDGDDDGSDYEEGGSGNTNDTTDENLRNIPLSPVFRPPAPIPPQPVPIPLPVLRVAFSARKASGVLTAPLHTVSFQDTLTNIGGGWQGSTFRAPYAGVYFFIFHAIGSDDSDFTLQLMVRDRREERFRVTAYGTEKQYEHGSNSAVLSLDRSDTVWLSLSQGRMYEHPGNEAYTSFSGFLLFPTTLF